MEPIFWIAGVWVLSGWLVGGLEYASFVNRYANLYRTARQRNAMRGEAAGCAVLGPLGLPSALIWYAGFEPLWFIPEGYKQDDEPLPGSPYMGGE